MKVSYLVLNPQTARLMGYTASSFITEYRNVVAYHRTNWRCVTSECRSRYGIGFEHESNRDLFHAYRGGQSCIESNWGVSRTDASDDDAAMRRNSLFDNLLLLDGFGAIEGIHYKVVNVVLPDGISPSDVEKLCSDVWTVLRRVYQSSLKPITEAEDIGRGWSPCRMPLPSHRRKHNDKGSTKSTIVPKSIKSKGV